MKNTMRQLHMVLFVFVRHMRFSLVSLGFACCYFLVDL